MNFADCCTSEVAHELQKYSLQSLQTVEKMSTLIIYVCYFFTINVLIDVCHYFIDVQQISERGHPGV